MKVKTKNGSLGGAQGQVNSATKACYIDITHNKPQTSNEKNFWKSELEDLLNLLRFEQKLQLRGGLTMARGPHAAHKSILCSPQGSHMYIDTTYFKSMLK